MGIISHYGVSFYTIYPGLSMNNFAILGPLASLFLHFLRLAQKIRLPYGKRIFFLVIFSYRAL